MALFSGSSSKNKQVELQNLIFGTDEKKLMVSQEFLDNMTTQYISKRMKSVNRNVEILFTAKSPRSYFTAYDSIMESLGELIKLQQYHRFKEPIPSEFRKTVESKNEKYTTAMINRAWKTANNRADFDPTKGEKRDPKKFAPILDEMLEYKDRYSRNVYDHVDRFYKSVYDCSIEDKLREEEAARKAAEAARKAAEEEAAREAAEAAEADDIPEDGELPDEEAENLKLPE